MNNFKKLAITQLQKRLFLLKKEVGLSIPKKGWIKTFRECYHMSAAQLAKKLEIVQSRVSAVEKGEIENRLTLDSLHRFADALNCDFFYAFVPREPIEDLMKKRAQIQAREKINNLAHTMKLEKQEVSKEELNTYYEQLLEEYKEHPSHLWDEK